MSDINSCGFWDKSHGCRVTLEALDDLDVFHRQEVPEEYRDAMGHMNVRYYMAIFDQAVWNLFNRIGYDRAYCEKYTAGGFALKHFIQYLAEVHIGDTVAVRTRVLGRNDKRFHFMHFMVNETKNRLAATLEALGTHVDMNVRRSSPMKPELAAAFDERLKRDQALSWSAPISGAMHT